MKKAPQNRDPVCGMMVDVDPHAIRATHGGVDYYFCASGCRDAFVADPPRYVAPAETPVAEPAHTRWGGITAPKFGSAGSGGAEYERGPARTGKR